MLNRILIAAALVAVSSGCALLEDSLDDVAKGAGKAVVFYCENVTIPEVREELRAAVNAYAAPNIVTIECASGGPALRTSGAPDVEPN